MRAIDLARLLYVYEQVRYRPEDRVPWADLEHWKRKSWEHEAQAVLDEDKQ